MRLHPAEPQLGNLQPWFPAPGERGIYFECSHFFSFSSANVISGQLGVLFYQSRTRAFVEEHLALEKEQGREINPAQPSSQVEVGGCSGGKSDDAVCATFARPELSW